MTSFMLDLNKAMISATPPSLNICTGVNTETDLQVNLEIFRAVLKFHFLGYDAMVVGKQYLTL
jgi:hypothetical protein